MGASQENCCGVWEKEEIPCLSAMDGWRQGVGKGGFGGFDLVEKTTTTSHSGQSF